MDDILFFCFAIVGYYFFSFIGVLIISILNKQKKKNSLNLIVSIIILCIISLPALLAGIWIVLEPDQQQPTYTDELPFYRYGDIDVANRTLIITVKENNINMLNYEVRVSPTNDTINYIFLHTSQVIVSKEEIVYFTNETWNPTTNSTYLIKIIDITRNRLAYEKEIET